MIVESPLIQLESVYTPVFYQKRFFRVKFLFQKNVLVIAFFIFCFGISALDFFYLSTLLECACRVWGLQSHSFVFISHFYFKKFKNICLSSCIAYCILHSTCTIFALKYQSGFHIGMLAFTIRRKLCILRSSIPFFSWTQCICIDCQVCILLHVVS